MLTLGCTSIRHSIIDSIITLLSLSFDSIATDTTTISISWIPSISRNTITTINQIWTCYCVFDLWTIKSTYFTRWIEIVSWFTRTYVSFWLFNSIGSQISNICTVYDTCFGLSLGKPEIVDILGTVVYAWVGVRCFYLQSIRS